MQTSQFALKVEKTAGRTVRDSIFSGATLATVGKV